MHSASSLCAKRLERPNIRSITAEHLKPLVRAAHHLSLLENIMNRRTLLVLFVTASVSGAGSAMPAPALAADLAVMQEHPLARQNYVAGAPLRESVGRGKVFTGTVISTRSGIPLAGARVEYWLNTTDVGGDDGERNPANRGYVVTDAQGRFRFETNPPARVWSNAAPHIHTRLSAAGHETFFYRHITNAAMPVEDVSIVLAVSRLD
jgi:hypothetical protein